MKAILLTTYFCIILRGTLSELLNESGDIEISPLIPAGYIEHRGKFYKLYSDKKTWQEARNVCKSDGADLATVDSREEALFLRSLIGGSYIFGYPGAWIGFRDMGNREWETVQSKSLKNTGYNVWWPGSGKLIGGCGTMKTCSRYDARECTVRTMFVCEYTT